MVRTVYFWHNKIIMKTKLVTFWRGVSERWHLNQLMTGFDRAQLFFVGPAFAYYALLTIFPTLIAAAVLISLVNVNGGTLLATLYQIMPANVYNILAPVLTSVLHSDYKTWLSFSLLFIVWAISQTISIFRRTFNRIANVDQQESGLLSRFWSFLWLAVILIAFIVLSMAANVISIMTKNLPPTPWNDFLKHQTGWLILLGLWFALMMMNYFLPTRQARAPFKAVAWGTAAELVMLFVLNKAFTFYAQLQVGKYGFYQSVSSMIVFLIWLNLLATILVVGYVIIMWLASFHKKGKITHV